MDKKGELVDEVIGSYKITKYLGGGGMSEGVYLATHAKLGNDVAIKVMDIGGGTTTEDRRRRIMDEPRKTARLHHPNIVRIIDLLEEGPRLFMVMDYVPGKTLFDYMREDRIDILQTAKITRDGIYFAPLENRVVGSFITQLGWALDYAHNQGLIHRDIKPSNIIITEINEEIRAILTDFGIAKALEATELSITREGVGIGTPPYMSPEQIKGLDLSAASDEYSLAIVAYEMLTGRVPFEGDSQMVIAHKHITEDPPLPRNLNPDISEQTEKVLLKALSKNPKDRYGHPGLFAKELANTLVSSTIELNLPSRSLGQRLLGSRGWGLVRRFWRSFQQFSLSCTTIFMRSFVYMVVGTILFLAVLGVGSIFLVSRFIEGRVHAANWRLNDYAETGSVTLHKDQMTSALNRTVQDYAPGIFEKLTINLQKPNHISISGVFSGSSFNINGLLFLSQSYPTIQITSINTGASRVQLFIFNIAVGGFNRGIVRALDDAGAEITKMEISPEDITMSLIAPNIEQEPVFPAAQPENYLLNDDFSNLGSGWPRSHTVEAAYLRYEDGQYKINIMEPNFMVIQDYPSEIQDFDITVELHIQEDSPPATQFGLVFAKQDSENFLSVVLTGDGFIAAKSMDRGSTLILFGWRHIDNIETTKPVKLRVLNDGINIIVFVSDNQVGSIALPSKFSTGGRFGLYAQTTEESPASVFFDNLSVAAAK
jgi:serine/threonine protein kinase